MKRTLAACIALVLSLALLVPTACIAQSPVPDSLPEDLGGKTFYGYMMELKNLYMPAKVFSDSTKYSDEDRENARRAATLTVNAVTQKLADTGTEDQYNLYLRAYAYDLLFQATGDEANRQAGLADYQRTVELGGAYAQADYDRLAALQVASAPIAWQMQQMLTLQEMSTLLALPQENIMLLGSAYTAADGSRRGAGYTAADAENPAAAAIYVLADPQGGEARYKVLKASAFLQKTTELNGLGDEAVLMGLRNTDNVYVLYTTALVLKDELVLQVRVPDAVWRAEGLSRDPAALAQAIAAQVLTNLYDSAREVPEATSTDLPILSSAPAFAAATADSEVPESLPADLGGKTEYGYLVELRQKYLPADAFTDESRTGAERNDSRRALKLMVQTLNTRLDTYGQNPYELEIRGACYAAAYADTGTAAFRMLAINDFKQALAAGYTLAKSEYDQLAKGLLEPMAEMPAGSAGENVALLQAWLTQAGYAAGQTAVLDEATAAAVSAFEQDHGLTPDGIVDIAFLLSLYAVVDDGDAALPGANV